MNLIEVEIAEESNEKIIAETLSRIGIGDKRNKILYPTAYLYKEDGKIYICHFKQLFLLRDNGYDNVSSDDLLRLKSIISCLYDWGMINVDLDKIEPCDSFVFILPYAEKKNWTIKHKYSLRNYYDEKE
jgi:translational regulator